MEDIEKMLESRRWAKDCLRVNITEPDKIIQRGKVKISLLQSEVLPKKETALRAAIQATAPEWWGDETQVLVNKNVQCKKHIDANDGHSYVLWLGDYSGGALLFEDGTRLEQKYTWHKINGRTPHWNEPHEGTKYAIVLYKRAIKHTKQQMMAKAIKKKKEQEGAGEA
jgi:hypothetical protein